MDGDLFVRVSHTHGHVNAGILRDAEDYTIGLILTEPRDRHGEVVLSRGNGSGDVLASRVRLEVTSDAGGGVLQRDGGIRNNGARVVADSAGEASCVLRDGGRRKQQELNYQKAELQSNGGPHISSCKPLATPAEV